MDGEFLPLPLEDTQEGAENGALPNFIDLLENFRDNWQHELQQRAKEVKLKGKRSDTSQDIEEKAKILFIRGVDAEQAGSFHQAVALYREAMQLVPDIEMRIDYTSLERQPRVRQESESSVGSADMDDLEDDLIGYIQKVRLQEDDNAICQPQFEQRAPHISCLPVEVFNYIFKWIISSELDTKALENLSLVCRGFYLCARDEEIWRLICLRIWGGNCGSCKKFGGWREMYIARPHLLFNGCYIGKCSYYRQGGKSLDGFYSPCHLVEYYRYARFFQNGVMYLHSSPHDPITMLAKLKSDKAKEQGMLKGYYRLVGDRVTGVLKRVKTNKDHNYMRHNRNKEQMSTVSNETYYVEFEITNAGKRKHSKLTWLQYYVHTKYIWNEPENVTDFLAGNTGFPSMIFSRVKSYCAVMSAPLK